MKISIITTVTDPDKRMDAWREAMNNYLDFADEVIVVNGGAPLILKPPLREILLPWPDDWSWEELPKHLNAGLQQATGDWVIKLDIDQFIHEANFEELRYKLNELDDRKMAVGSLMKVNVYFQGKYAKTGGLNIAINKKRFDDAVFGKDINIKTDLCEPIKFTGEYDDKGVPVGIGFRDGLLGNTGINCWNFSYAFKTKEVCKDIFYRQALAYERYFGKAVWGKTREGCWNRLINAYKAVVQRGLKQAEDFNIFPKYIRDTYANLKPEQFGYNGWGII